MCNIKVEKRELTDNWERVCRRADFDVFLHTKNWINIPDSTEMTWDRIVPVVS